MLNKKLFLAGVCLLSLASSYSAKADDEISDKVISSPSLSFDGNNNLRSGSPVAKQEAPATLTPAQSENTVKKDIVVHHVAHKKPVIKRARVARAVIEPENSSYGINSGQPGDIAANPIYISSDIASWTGIANDIVEHTTMYIKPGTPIYIPHPLKKSSEFSEIFYHLLKTSYIEHGYVNIVDEPVDEVLIYYTKIFHADAGLPQIYLNIGIQNKSRSVTNQSRVYAVEKKDLHKYRGKNIPDNADQMLNQDKKCIQFLTPDYYGEGVQLNCLTPGLLPG